MKLDGKDSTISVLCHFRTKWQTKTEQSLSGFKFFCFVVDVKCGGGKKTSCVLLDALCEGMTG